MFLSQALPDAYAATVAEEMRQQNFHPINGSRTRTRQPGEDGGLAVNNMYIEIGYVLYLGADADAPALELTPNG